MAFPGVVRCMGHRKLLLGWLGVLGGQGGSALFTHLITHSFTHSFNHLLIYSLTVSQEETGVFPSMHCTEEHVCTAISKDY